MRTIWLLLLSIFPLLNLAAPAWHYQLLDGSYLLDECLICDRVSIPVPMRGSFELRQVEVTPFSQRFAIENAQFTAENASGRFEFKGSGTYDLLGDFAVRQVVTLAGDLQTPTEMKKVGFTNESNIPTRRWPMLEFRLVQTNGTVGSTISFQINAAPLQEIWFSTSTNFTRAIKLDNSVSDGDLLSTVGRIVKRNDELQNFPGPTYANIGLDAVDVLPGGDIAFSALAKGALNDGDFAIAPTGAITRWQDFMTVIDPGLAGDPGLDGLQVEGANVIHFSTKKDVGVYGHGDILVVDTEAPTGSVFRKNSDLMARFHPNVAQDYGLDAMYIWPQGEIWFSTATGFTDTQLGAISDGDLLSDAGYVVYRNADLTAALQPVGDPPTDFGLDAVFVVSDFNATTDEVTIGVGFDRGNNSVTFSWKGNGRVSQLYRAAEVTGPWDVWTPIFPGSTYSQPADGARSFFRLRQW